MIPTKMTDNNDEETFRLMRYLGDLPQAHDIITGRNHQPRTHPGNVYLRRLVASYYERYMTSNRDQRRAICFEILALVSRLGRRFVAAREDPLLGIVTEWIEIRPTDAFLNVQSRFRNITRILRRRHQQRLQRVPRR